jgi:aminoglycoside phosphotransferase (APT) family kinase protein
MARSVSSERLGLLTAAQIGAALARFGLGEFVDAAVVPFGLFGQNVFVTSTDGLYVLRGAPHYPWQFPHERHMARLLHERTAAPVPWPYLLDPADDIFGWSYALMPRLPGRQLADPAVIAGLAPGERRGVAVALGEMLARIHALTWPVAGRYDPAADAILPFDGGYEAWVVDDVRRHLARSRGHSTRTTAADVAWVEAVIAAAVEAPDDADPPRVVMNDYKEGNAVVLPDAGSPGGWRVSGVFDLMEAHVGNREMDLCRQVALYLEAGRPELAEAFVRAYDRARPLPPGAAARFPLFMLRDRLIVWEYVQRTDPKARSGRGTLRDWAGPFLAFRLPGIRYGGAGGRPGG